MKNKKMLHMMDVIDNDLIEGANPEKITPKRKKFTLRYGMLAACLVLAIVAVNLAVFLPFLNGDNIETNDITNNPPQSQDSYKSIFDKIAGYQFSGVDKNEGATNAPGASPDVDSPEDVGGGNQEVTDNQVNGVIEGDLFKRTNEHIFYFSPYSIRAYSINGEDSCLVGEYILLDSEKYIYKKELHLSEDGGTLTAIYSYGWLVTAVSLDVSNPSKMVKKNEFSVQGQLVSTRRTNGKFIVLTSYYVDRYKLDENKPNTYIPYYDKGEGSELLAPSDIFAPDVLYSDSYAIVTMLDENSLSHNGTMAFLSYSYTWYVSQGSIYLTNVQTERTTTQIDKNIRITFSVDYTDITRISYESGRLKAVGTATVKGVLKDQYSLDEYEGNLRVVSTVRLHQTKSTEQTDGSYIIQGMGVKTNASLYCIGIDKMKTLSSVEEFAPEGESVQSVRFDKTAAYVCTSVIFSDPVFYFDLTDVNNITYKDTGTIAGYSTSLKPLGNGYLLGIGWLDWDTFKLEIYKETETGVISVASFVEEDLSVPSNYKSYNIDTVNKIIGFSAYDHSDSGDHYAGPSYYLLGYELGEDGVAEFTVLNIHKLRDGGQLGDNRGVLIDGYYYIITPHELAVKIM